DALVVVVHRDRQRPLGAALADHVPVELPDDLLRRRILRPLRGLFLGEDVVAELDALVADEDARSADELPDLAPLLTAEGTVEFFHATSSFLHRGVRSQQTRVATGLASRARRHPNRPRGCDVARRRPPSTAGACSRECRFRLDAPGQFRTTGPVRILVVCDEPGSATREPESALSILIDLGCRVTACRFDLGDL